MNIRKIWHFLQAWNKKTDDSVLFMGYLIVTLIGTAIIYNVVDWKDSLYWLERSFFSFIFAFIIMVVMYIISLVLSGVSKWIFGELIPKFKETQKDFDYKPSDQAKVKFK